MQLYSENENYKLYEGSMLDMLETIEINSIDSIVTDPPYELNFMGKGWDNSGIAFQSDTWKKCYEVLKPGGYLLAFGGSRTFHRIACAIEDAGFEIRDTIMWLYGSGFPKSMDISKSLDKRNGRNIEIYKEIGNHIKQKREEKNISLKEMNNIFDYVAGCNWWESQNDNNVRLPNLKDWKKLKELINVSSKYDEIIEREEAKGEKIGEKIRGNAGFSNEQVPRPWKEKIGKIYDINAPATDLAKKWQGWGTALKPSFEPIIVARKPFKGSLVDNVIEYGVGGINIDECRVEAIDKEKLQKNWTDRKAPAGFNGDKSGIYGSGKTDNTIAYTPNGRFPGNTILTYDDTDFDEVCGGFPNTKTGSIKPHKNKNRQMICYGLQPENITINFNGDSGSASRYFYCAKASKKDRDEGLDDFEEKNTMCDRNPKLASANMPQNRSGNLRKNTHPTVKPTNLMQYLVRLVTPKGGTILDPFNGSGSTGKAVMYENKERDKNYKYIGIELTEEYLPIAKARIEYICNLIEEGKTKDKQMTIFDIDN